MHFVLIGRDGADDAALARRMAARDAHLAGVAALKTAGHALLGVALVDDAGKMCGSLMLLDFADRAALDAWLETEPYVTGGVWQSVEVVEGRVAPSFQALFDLS